MATNTPQPHTTDFDLPYADVAELKANQSVRATFRLSENTILAMNIVSTQLGVKQKSLFDHLIADTEALEAIARDALVEFSIKRLKPVIEQEKNKQEVRKRIAQKVRANLEIQKQLLLEANEKLGEEDPVCRHLANAVERLKSAYRSIHTFVQKGEKITEFTM
ncbi:MAG: hypothetical protein P8X96_01655 [Desulfobacteraceae bacterium]